MKKISFVLFSIILVLTTSCNNMKEENARLKAKNDSLLTLGFQKDTTVMEFIRTFNEIQTNLDSIKRKENIISQSTAEGIELQPNKRDQINGDINAIYLMLQRNRELVNSLKSKLKKSESSLSSANIKVSDLEKMIDNLNKDIRNKDSEIPELKNQLAKMDFKVKDLDNQVTTLNTNVDDLNAKNKAKQEDLDAKNIELNTAYYVIGTSKELRSKKIINKTGGFIGIGRSKSVSKELDKTYFTKVDISKLASLPILSKKANLLSNHPTNSYKFENSSKKSIEKIVILNHTEFWSRSKYLVIVTE